MGFSARFSNNHTFVDDVFKFSDVARVCYSQKQIRVALAKLGICTFFLT
jgi:hypothetical protein